MKISHQIGVFGGIMVVIFVAAVVKHISRVAAQKAAAASLCYKWAEKLDGQTNDAGVYIQHEGDLPESDPWGNPLVVDYSRGGGMEVLKVRSFGPDGKGYTGDDLVFTRHSANLAGIGAGIRDGVEETAEGATRGGVRGALDALGERGLLPGKTPEEE